MWPMFHVHYMLCLNTRWYLCCSWMINYLISLRSCTVGRPAFLPAGWACRCSLGWSRLKKLWSAYLTWYGLGLEQAPQITAAYWAGTQMSLSLSLLTKYGCWPPGLLCSCLPWLYTAHLNQRLNENVSLFPVQFLPEVGINERTYSISCPLTHNLPLSLCVL